MIDIVIAEDSTAQAMFLKQALEENGYSVRRGKDGAEALELIREKKPALVISDIEMPMMTGYELCSAIKTDETLKDLPVVLVSALSDAEDIIQGLRSGADNYLTKPYEVEFMLARVKNLISAPSQLTSGAEQQGLEVTLGGKRHTISSDSQQILNLLMSTFENAVQQNGELIRANQQLTTAQEELKRNNTELDSLNVKLTSANTRMKKDLDAAAKAQQALLPTSLPDIAGVNVAWEYQPCDELAGDILNVFKLDENHLGLYVLDVSGHGVPASLLSVTLNHMMLPGPGQTALMRSENGKLRLATPAEVAEQLNAQFQMGEVSEKFFTLVYGILNVETREFRYVCAGHEPPFLIANGDEPRELDMTGGLPVGIMEGADYEYGSMTLNPGDRLFFYSDGVNEAMDSGGEQFGMQRLSGSIQKSRSEPLTRSVATLLSDVENWVGDGEATDDVSILALEVVGS